MLRLMSIRNHWFFGYNFFCEKEGSQMLVDKVVAITYGTKPNYGNIGKIWASDFISLIDAKDKF